MQLTTVISLPECINIVHCDTFTGKQVIQVSLLQMVDLTLVTAGTYSRGRLERETYPIITTYMFTALFYNHLASGRSYETGNQGKVINEDDISYIY